MLTRVPTEFGIYSVQQYVRLHVWPNKPAYFHVEVNFKRNGIKKKLESKFYLQDNKDFEYVKQLAIKQAREFYREVRKRDDVFLAAEIQRKQVEHDLKLAKRDADLQVRVLKAKQDVQGVWERYGPEVDMLKPFYIFQW